MGVADLKIARPIRYKIAVLVYRGLWWPAVAVAAPFVLFASLIDWLSWTAIPAIGKIMQPPFGAVHGAAQKVGDLILGYRREPQQ